MGEKRWFEEYRALLGRLERAYRMPENVRENNAGLLAEITVACEDARIKATAPVVFGDEPVHPDDPLRAWADGQWGTVSEIARRRAGNGDEA